MSNKNLKVCIIVLDSSETDIDQLLENIARGCGIEQAQISHDNSFVVSVKNTLADARDTRREAFFATLTPQKQKVVYRAVCGLGNRQIARIMDIAPGVVAEHLTEVYQKLEAFERDNGSLPGVISRHSLIRFFGDYFENHPLGA